MARRIKPSHVIFLAQNSTAVRPAVTCRQEMEKFGPGKVRSMEQWTEWSGVNFKDPSAVAAGDKFCREDIPMDKSRLCPVSPEAKAVFDAASTAAQ